MAHDATSDTADEMAAIRQFEGKTVIVTGAGQGLGRSHALHLAGLGARVVANDLSDGVEETVAMVSAAGGEAVAVRGSVSNWADGANIVQRALDAYGDVHMLVNNAGFLRDGFSFAMDEAQFDAVVDVHLKGHFVMCHHVGKYFRDQHKAGVEIPRRIINTTSESGIFGGPGQANYGAAKGGIVSLSFILAKELGRSGVTVNTIAPRARTAMTESNPRFAKPDEGFDKYDPEHVSRVLAWLLSDDMGDVSGQVFICAGSTVHLLAPPTVAHTVVTDGAWTPEALRDAKDALFGDFPRVVPAWGGPA